MSVRREEMIVFHPLKSVHRPEDHPGNHRNARFGAGSPCRIPILSSACIAVFTLLLSGAVFAQDPVNQAMSKSPNARIELADNPVLAVSVFTVECWVKADSRIVIVSRDKPASREPDWSVVYEYTNARVEFMTQMNAAADEYFWSPAATLVNKAWNHVALVVNGPAGTLRIYVNGNLTRSANFSPRNFSVVTGLAWGGYYGASPGGTAMIDEARYWNVERTEAQIQAVKDKKLGPTDRAGLIGYWMFCGDYADSSQYGHHMLPIGTPQILDALDLPKELACGVKGNPPAPVVIALGPTRFCKGDSVELDAGPGYRSYLWSTGEQTRTIFVRNSGAWTVTVTDSNGSKGTSPIITITAFPPAPPTVMRRGDTLISSPALSYQWMRDGTPIQNARSQSLIVGQSGIYTVQIVDSNGCVATSMGLVITPSPFILALGPTRFCEGDSVVLDAGTGYHSYRWSTGETTRRIVVRQSGVFTVNVTDVNGISGTSPPIAVITSRIMAPTITRRGDTLISTEARSYQWYHDGNPIPGATDRRFIMNGAGAYLVLISDSNGCVAASARIIIPGDPVQTVAGIGCADSVYFNPGEHVFFHLHLTSSTHLGSSGIVRYRVVLRFRKNVLQPILDSASSMNDIGAERILTIDGVREASFVSGPLLDIPMIVMLGDTTCTRVHLESFVWIDGPVETTLDQTECAVCVRTCNEGGTRLFIANGPFLRVQNSPNPFQGETVISFEIVEDGMVHLAVFDALGRKISDPLHGYMTHGTHSFVMNAAGFPPGAYFYLLDAGAKRAFGSMLIRK